ncbi:MBL fold metallo-hydrolase [Fulvivirgaceae bacterium BMA10]|uniref:MBL fold metallo-hydrolase n=1 Tax=Splendidivirga corallicola TaxID=3051826 RepID=A0ABT8KKM5_9BACT|nr:MBL fold metallo-hydrolase [Fulvivirgaceae bacterium BMA10]
MSIIKSFAVGNGDMFYIDHNSSNLTIIDCCLSLENKRPIVQEIKNIKEGKQITRFISTHPDQDHIEGLKYLDEQIDILNFYTVKNKATKKEETEDFQKYCQLRDDLQKAFFLERGCSRKWMNICDETNGSSGINVLWPIVSNQHYKDALKESKNGNSPNNISPIIKYSIQNGASMIWMGDLETDFMENIINEITLPSIDILFAPHHGRESGKVPEKWLDEMNPKIIVIGEAPAKNLNYYQGYNTITQNSAGDIIFDCGTESIHIYVSDESYSVDFLEDESQSKFKYYLGTLKI